MIQVDGLNRLYGDFHAVKDVSFTIGRGEIVGLLGHNGAGKTTIMKMLTGFLEPSSGSIRFDDLALEEHRLTIQSWIGYLSESLPVYPEMSVLDYLFYCADMRRIAKSEQDERVISALKKTELQEKALDPISTLSRGFKQRVGVAQALIHNPKLLILDEPTNGLDPHQTQQMRDLIRALASDATVILSTHIMQEVEALCDRVLILDRGQLVVDKSLAELRGVDGISISCNANTADLKKLCQGKQVELLSSEAGVNHFRVSSNDADDNQQFCSQLASAIIGAGHQLYEISVHRQNLEQIFSNIYDRKELDHAA